ncbi:ABC transporter permease [Ethanoligenens harbinense]|uniref:Binding-protein-dependent transport systems inner membrane component n=1 Tax=Ethanoligenens harbinense (strain DSM 18485 / JCM 12961 / CGMCC 1.5033 / YUAN-3) TaxID=663278 RepID=E6U9E7_ETHHY|nr:ABC transporter permease subunit [Ethanoligenens harbinense]ADU26138.1 binding-protein-dependent transport systems inner membrane component [Ethanoligenens harbinense YUAN-3]AVQ95282.1 ABC transporter permease [Ethanoligenens harbinense YUAN-3]AYF37946.1 ABC transporter permease [Ethanoligenens harbinense]AYF40693.1 ABC transporter permease [Ethanoligenens harbinense]QCN91526.1 ABC transporter permease subunit [Ethanoligenens harbinense]
MKKIGKCLLPLLPFLLLVFLFELLPIVMMAVTSFQSQTTGGFTLLNYWNIFTKRYYWEAIINSVSISVFSSLVGIGVAFLGGMALQNVSGRTKNAFSTLLNITSNFAGIPLAIAYVVLLGNTGILVLLGKTCGWQWLAGFNLYSINGLGLIYIYFQIPVSTLLLMPAFAGIRGEWMESAELLHASRWRFWFHVGLPVMLPSLVGTFCFLFANSMAAYASAYALMGSNFSLMTTLISSMISGDVFPQYGLSSALSVVMIVLVGAAILISHWLSNRDGKGEGAHEA